MVSKLHIDCKLATAKLKKSFTNEQYSLKTLLINIVKYILNGGKRVLLTVTLSFLIWYVGDFAKSYYLCAIFRPFE